MGTLWNRSSSLEWDNNAVLADGALAYFYEAGTSTPKAVYQDGAESTAHEFPLEADGGRWPAVFIPFGSYKVVIKTSGGTTLFSADEVPNPEPFDDTFELDTTTVLNTGDIFFSLKNGTRTGAVRLNGRTIGSAASAATERANADCATLFAFLWNNIANGQAAVSTGRGATAAADFAANKTITLPSAQGCGPVGFDDMGNTAASLLGSAPVVSGSAILAGSTLGENTHVLVSGELAAHTHAISITSGAGGSHTHTFSATTASNGAHTHTAATGAEAAHTHTVTTATTTFSYTPGGSSSGTLLSSGSGNNFSTGAGSSHTHSISSDGAHTHTVSGTTDAEAAHTHLVSGTSASTGSSTAHNNLARSLTVTWFIKL